jgi:hypothetical protein
MTAVLSKMKCLKCGAEMNCHAEKIVFGFGGGDETDVRDESLLEFHACPNCCAAASRVGLT